MWGMCYLSVESKGLMEAIGLPGGCACDRTLLNRIFSHHFSIMGLTYLLTFNVLKVKKIRDQIL